MTYQLKTLLLHDATSIQFFLKMYKFETFYWVKMAVCDHSIIGQKSLVFCYTNLHFNVSENVKENNPELFLGWEDPYLLIYHLQNGKHDTLLSYGYTS